MPRAWVGIEVCAERSVGAGLLMLSSWFALSGAILFGLGLIAKRGCLDSEFVCGGLVFCVGFLLPFFPVRIACVRKVLNVAINVGVSELVC